MKTDQDKRARNWESRQRWVLGFLLLIAVVSTLILGMVLTPPGPGGNAVDLELAGDAAGFADAVARGWRQENDQLCGLNDRFEPDGYAPDGPYFGTLRCHLFVDSLGFVPGYVGLLTIFTLLLAPIAGLRRTLLVHALCVPAIAAGLFDIAENGMTILAAENLMDGLLVDATVQDVRLASLCKWSLVAAAFAVLAGLAWRAVATCRTADVSAWPLRVAAVGAALCAVMLVAGLASAFYGLLAPGMIPGAIALALLGGWRFASARSMPALLGA
jgi:hypothetical protein